MKILAGGCRVFSSEDGEVHAHGAWRERIVVCRTQGAGRITQTVNDYPPGAAPALVNPGAEEVLYVASGEGVCHIDGSAYPIQRGCAVFIPPGAVYAVENNSSGLLRTIGSCCPEDPERHIVERAPAARSGQAPRLTLHEDQREAIRAGEDRVFRYLVNTDLGCREITQFAGWIPHSKAPFHFHPYEEAIFILEGRGVVHVDEEECEFGPGSSIYFPVGVRHCVENPEKSPIKLLGAFYPSGSPGAAYEDQ